MVVNLRKVSLYIDEETWRKFKEEVFRRHGTLKKLSGEVEALVGTVLVEGALATTFKDLGINVRGTISSKEVEQDRPLLKGPPSEQLVRGMRGKRVAESVP